MIDQNNFKDVLSALNFIQSGERWIKLFPHTEARLAVDFEKQQIIYPEDQGLKVNVRTTCNLSANENFVVFECVHRLLEKGYKPEGRKAEPLMVSAEWEPRTNPATLSMSFTFWWATPPYLLVAG